MLTSLSLLLFALTPPIDPLAEQILNMNVKQGDLLIADLDKEAGLIKFEFRKTILKRLGFSGGRHEL